MAARLLTSLKRVPVPLFGSATTAVVFARQKANALPRMAPWGLPLGAGALWFVWPAVDEEWKQSMGISSPPAGAPAPAEDKADAVELSEEAMEKVEKAYVVETVAVELSDEEKHAMKAFKEGNFAEFEKDWDAFCEKAIVPGEDDDDDDDDDDEDEEEEEEEEEEDDEE